MRLFRDYETITDSKIPLLIIQRHGDFTKKIYFWNLLIKIFILVPKFLCYFYRVNFTIWSTTLHYAVLKISKFGVTFGSFYYHKNYNVVLIKYYNVVTAMPKPISLMYELQQKQQQQKQQKQYQMYVCIYSSPTIAYNNSLLRDH